MQRRDIRAEQRETRAKRALLESRLDVLYRQRRWLFPDQQLEQKIAKMERDAENLSNELANMGVETLQSLKESRKQTSCRSG